MAELVPLINTLLCGAMAVVAMRHRKESRVHQVFATGLLLFAASELAHWYSLQTLVPQAVSVRHRLASLTAGFLPGVWLVFSLSYVRTNRHEIVRKWRWLIAACLFLPVAAILISGGLAPQLSLFPLSGGGWIFPLDLSSRLILVLWIVTATLILANLERTLRGAVGRLRWQIKFMVLGLGAIFGLRIYTSSHALLFGGYSTDLALLDSIGLLAGAGLMTISLRRSRVLDLDVYLSQTALRRSAVVFVVGAYLVGVGVLSQAVAWLGWGDVASLQTIIVFFALVLLSAALLSDRVHQGFETSVSRHFKRPSYDYRRLWADFNARTTGVTSVRQLARGVAEMTSEMFRFHAVAIWTLRDRGRSAFLEATTVPEIPLGSTVRLAAVNNLLPGSEGEALVDLEAISSSAREGFESAFGEFASRGQDRYLVPIRAQDKLLGFMALGQRVRNQPLSLEDRELLETLAYQLGSQLLNLRLSNRLQRNREMEAFQRVSTFFVHDLKNVASRLSLTVRNLPQHFDNPEFRSDALRTITESVDKMQEMSGRLTALKDDPKLKQQATDVTELVRRTLESFNVEGLGDRIESELEPVPSLAADPEQLQRVVENLLLNAHEAAPDQTLIRVQTTAENGVVTVEVRDSGCGMSPEFISRKLFKPFQTTKKRGMGIGLFQSRAIVEAHGGRIEVQSEEGVGSTFRVVLPVSGE